MPLFSISELKKAAREHSPIEAVVHAQIEKISRKDAANGKPFYEVIFRDAAESMTLRAWSDTAAFEHCGSKEAGVFVMIEGQFGHSASYGLDAKGWEMSPLSDEDADLLLEGSAERIDLLDRAYAIITEAVKSLKDPRLLALCSRFLTLHGSRFDVPRPHAVITMLVAVVFWSTPPE